MQGIFSTFFHVCDSFSTNNFFISRDRTYHVEFYSPAFTPSSLFRRLHPFVSRLSSLLLREKIVKENLARRVETLPLSETGVTRR